LAVDLNALGRVAGAHQRHAAQVVHHLGIDVLRRAEHHQSRPLRAAGDLAPYPEVTPIPAVRLRPDLMDLAHGLFRRRLGRLAGLPPDLLAHVADSFAFVRLGGAGGAGFRRPLPDELFVHALDSHEHVVIDRDLDARRRVIRDRVRESDDELHAEGLGLRLVSYALDLERLGESFGDAVDHVGDERPRQSVQRLVPGFVGRALDDDGFALHGDGQLRVHDPADLALRARDRDPQAVELSGDALWQHHGLPADA